MKRSFAATDFSTRAHRATWRAALLARRSGAELTLLHIVVGPHGCSGMAKMLFGSVAEQLLRTVEIDILAAPRRAMAR